ncbi:DUF3727 domain-containing protein [Leptolyngbyaceae cyanobacterium CCMR0082]|uniref:DUF3727 domain-containing protein n=2 Tax=Adonisia turfae TaxID=2950184 RepID=A0A6M0SEY9_9CYAN|nr:DUF3727 domain-containing protein [Adonisia turfae]MDV3350362.1 DUF3727 domain-containing protein [Leptothoe sp. LEGE 181152]NEZ58836.1 DUF3727 domain-containing protein [Adonisia turfae CCMR0081]NEZ66571.1 DUF3727 domain-containing protein [Adonisia turfae CCMR0082]
MANLNHNSNQNSDPSPDFQQGGQPIVTLTDEGGHTLACYVEKSITLSNSGQEYLLLLPVSAPIEIFSWQDNDDTLADIEDEEIDPLFPSARAVLAELDLTLQRSAYTLTAVGNIPDAEDESCFALEVDDGGATDNFQMLAQFYHRDQRYVTCTPLEPLLFFAYRTDADTVMLLSPEEFQRLQPQIEDQLFEGLD